MAELPCFKRIRALSRLRHELPGSARMDLFVAGFEMTSQFRGVVSSPTFALLSALECLGDFLPFGLSEGLQQLVECLPGLGFKCSARSVRRRASYVKRWAAASDSAGCSASCSRRSLSKAASARVICRIDLFAGVRFDQLNLTGCLPLHGGVDAPAARWLILTRSAETSLICGSVSAALREYVFNTRLMGVNSHRRAPSAERRAPSAERRAPSFERRASSARA